MKFKFAVAATILLLGMSMSCWAQEDGAALYQKKCASCHGANGEGKGKIPALKGSTKEADAIAEHIAKGESASKPPHNKGISGLTEEQTKAIAAYVKSL